MNLNNTYRLLHDKWFIHQAYGKALLPQAFQILSGNQKDIIEFKESKEAFIGFSQEGTVTPTAENFSTTDNKEQYVLIVDLKNPIYKYNQACGPRGTKHKMQIMSMYESDPNMKGVVLDIDSGGGQVSGTPEFHDFIKNYSKPVVAYTDGYMCSAAYYIGAAANHIVANKRADHIGSIGAMISFVDMTGYYEKQGAKVITEYATKSTEKNRDFEELLQGNPEAYIKNQLDPIVEDFHADMQDARENLNTKVLAGGTWPAQKALQLNLIDEIGTLQTAIDKVFSLAKNKTQNNINMTTENLQQINAVLGVESLEATDNGVFLNQDQLETINQALANNSQAIIDAQAETQTANENLTAAQNNADAINTALQTALQEAEVENAENLTAIQGIEALAGLVAEYGANDGAKPTTVAGGTNQESVNPNIVGGIDVSAAMNN